jgi:hypothetical protein
MKLQELFEGRMKQRMMDIQDGKAEPLKGPLADTPVEKDGRVAKQVKAYAEKSGKNEAAVWALFHHYKNVKTNYGAIWGSVKKDLGL